jgi:DNA invertase Pin-like site-specific DNA recombinase
MERQREGIAKAKAEGKYMGHKPTAREKAAEVKALAGKGLAADRLATWSRVAIATIRPRSARPSPRPLAFSSRAHTALASIASCRARRSLQE